MDKSFENLQELAFIINVQKHSPSILNIEFLKGSGIIAEDWELARQPLTSNRASQIVFQNGVSLAAQGNQIVFTESIGSKDLTEIKVPGVIRNYISALPNLEYSAVSVSLRSFANQTELGIDPKSYITQRLVAQGPWQDVGQDTVKASIQFAFSMEHGQLALSVNEAQLQLSEEEMVPVIMFSGNVNHNIAEENTDEGLNTVQEVLEGWQQDVISFRDIVRTRFLDSEVIALEEIFDKSEDVTEELPVTV